MKWQPRAAPLPRPPARATLTDKGPAMRPLTSRKKLLLACALAAAVVASVAFAVWPREPVYGGKPLNDWLDQLAYVQCGRSFLPDPRIMTAYLPVEVSVRAAQAEEAITELGPRCLPSVLYRLRSKSFTYDLQIRAADLHLCRYPPYVSDPIIRRGQAVTALIKLGNTAKPVLPQVMAIAKTDPDPGVRASALEVLRHLSPWRLCAGHRPDECDERGSALNQTYGHV